MRPRILARCRFCRRWMWRRAERYCARCENDARDLAREVGIID